VDAVAPHSFVQRRKFPHQRLPKNRGLAVAQAEARDSCLGTKRRAVIPYPICIHGVVHVAGCVKFRPPYNVGGGELRIGRIRPGKNCLTPITVREGILIFLLE